MTYKENHEIIRKLKEEIQILRKAYYNYDSSMNIEKSKELKAKIDKLNNEIKFIQEIRKATQNENIKTRGV